MSDGRFAGRTAVVTGAASGIGLAVATRLARDGARVLLTDWHERRGADAAERLATGGLAVEFHHHDAGDQESWDRLRTALTARGGRLDLLVNNAYSGRAADFETLTPEVLEACLRVNVNGALMGLRLASELMTNGGAVVNMSSVAALEASPDNLGYAAAKLAVIQLTKAAARSLGARKPPIRVNAVAPGYVETPALASTTRALEGLGRDDGLSEAYAALAAGTALGRIGQPAELANVIAFLLSDEASFVTGQCWVADGGLTL